ncbi:allene oxide cyclase barrel-like domain-containing protein [Streptomyces buecherae]|uniref:Allene oxide cyclase barrel-like domain-containing protein n=1 Tax=Streptomyces buecherae TaxID=2763006 RepID=A0A7H8N6A0_9ACTN|nr:hypothetical protein [Streptomyces buecherae]QKW49942.1 hypothetical protein HUT08_10740 [Streptomyces buecherae]
MGIENAEKAVAYGRERESRRGNRTKRATVKRLLAASLAAAAVGVCVASSADANPNTASGNTATAHATSSSTTHAKGAEKGRPVEVIDIRLDNDQHAETDLGPAGPSLGDFNSFSGWAVKDGRRIGLGAGSCKTVHIEGKKSTTQCLITVELDRGSVTMQSLATKGATELDMAVTGGTGAYNGARGIARYWAIGTPDECMQLRLLR